jgi:hypothetical protein
MMFRVTINFGYGRKATQRPLANFEVFWAMCTSRALSVKLTRT